MRILYTSAKGLECEWETYFDEYVAESSGILSVGNVVIDFEGEGSLDAYVIDWYLNDTLGEKQFSTGFGLDGQGYYGYAHPFSGEGEALNVVTGLWIPLIRFIIVDGEKYLANHKPVDVANNHCQLPTINVQANDCESGNLTSGFYTHRVSFNGRIDDISLGTQHVDFVYNANTRYMAFLFRAYAEQDRLTVKRVSGGTETVLWDGVCGTNNPTNLQFTLKAFPYIVSRDPIYFVVDAALNGYTEGDYLRIEIIGASETNQVGDTSWYLDMVCLNDGEEEFSFGCPTPNTDLPPTISDINWVWNPDTCMNNLTFTASNNATVHTNFWWYFMGSGVISGYLKTAHSLSFRDNTTIGNNFTTLSKQCIGFDNYMTLKKIGNVFTLEFIDEDHYNEYKNDYTAILNNQHIQQFDSSDPTKRLYYMYLNIFNLREQSTCFDTGSPVHDLNFWFGSNVVLDDENLKITITAQAMDTNPDGTVKFVYEECVAGGNFQLYANNVAATLALDDFTIQTKTVHHTSAPQSRAFVGRFHIATLNYDTSLGAISAFYNLNRQSHAELFCDADTWCIGSYNRFYAIRSQTLQVIITDMDDPHNNFEIYDTLDHNQEYGDGVCPRTQAWNLLYKAESLDEDSDV